MRVLRGKVDELKDTAINGFPKSVPDEQAASAAETKAAEVKSSRRGQRDRRRAPGNLRFAGLFVLVGTALMSVATVQFGGHSALLGAEILDHFRGRPSCSCVYP